ncbi:MAG: guanylate kinase [Candidatus Limnocylindrales bacterium]
MPERKSVSPLSPQVSRDSEDGSLTGEPCLGAPGALLVIISGPSGVGKDTIIRTLKQHFPDPKRHFVVTYKSRPRRPDEVDGIDYHFVSPEQFRELRAAGELLEAAEVHGHWSGTPRDQVVQALAAGHDAILKIDVQGARAIREKVPEALMVFVAPPSFEALTGRLRGRATESASDFDRRQRDAALELARQDDYDHVVVNETGQVLRTASRIDEIMDAAHELYRDRRITV